MGPSMTGRTSSLGSGLRALEAARAFDRHPAQGPDRAVQAAGSCRALGTASAAVLRGRSSDSALFLGFAQSFLHLGVDGFQGVVNQGRLSVLVRRREPSGNVVLSVTGSVGGLSRSFAAMRSPVPSGGSRRASDVVPVAQDGTAPLMAGLPTGPVADPGAGLRLPGNGQHRPGSAHVPHRFLRIWAPWRRHWCVPVVVERAPGPTGGPGLPEGEHS